MNDRLPSQSTLIPQVEGTAISRHKSENLNQQPIELQDHEKRSNQTLRWEATPFPFVIALANQKGGVAKTTSAASLAGALALNGQEVLAVDLDTQANLTLALGKDPSRLRNAISDVLFNAGSLVSVSRETPIQGLDLAPSDPDMELAERFLPVRKNFETILRSAIEEITPIRSGPAVQPRMQTPGDLPQFAPFSTQKIELSNNKYTPRPVYDFIILDCPPSIGAVTLNALNAADMLIIPSQPEYFSAHALRSMMGTIQQIRNRYNPNLVYRILITMFDKRNRIHREVEQQIRDTFKSGVFNTHIGIDTQLRESALQGLPITHFKTNSRSSQQYTALAQELIAYVQSKSTD